MDKKKEKSDYENIEIGLNIPKLTDVIRIMEEKQQAKLMSSPSIITLNNQEGHIWVGSREFVSSIYGQPEELKLGLTLSVLPHIGESDLITLDIECELSDMDDGQKIVNRVLAKEGQTFLLGGMIKVNEIKVKKRVPILGHILPFIFSRSSTEEEVLDVLLLLTPHLVDVESVGEQALEMKKGLVGTKEGGK